MTGEKNEYDGCRVEEWSRGWRVVRHDGSVIEPLFDTLKEAEKACREWQSYADNRKST